jgi:ADP-ribose pyrophosphatase
MRAFEGKMFDVLVEDGKELVGRDRGWPIVGGDCDRQVTLVRQQRAPAGGPLLELPAGGVEEGETPLATARRELREETGLHGGDWTEVAAFFTTPGFCDERMHLFLARELEQGDAEPEESEQLELVRVPLDDVPALLPEIEDGKTLAGLLLLLRL